MIRVIFFIQNIMNWAPFPLLRVAVALSAGVFAREQIGFNLIFSTSVLVIALIAWILTEIYWRNLVTKSTITGLLMLCFVFFSGVLLVDFRYDKLAKQQFDTDAPVYLTGTLTEKLKSVNRPKYVLSTEYIRSEQKLIPHKAKVIVSFKTEDSTANRYDLGYRIFLKVKLKHVVKNTNPAAFDYSNYLKHKGIQYLGFVREGDHHIYEEKGFSLFRHWATESTLFTEKVIHKYITSEEASSIAEALLIGQKLNITDEIYKSYTDTGAIHVLSVSGMHVAIFISIFIMAFNRIRWQTLYWKIFKVASLLAIVWFYVILTGMAPSVVRAGTMVSLYLIGGAFFKGYNTYNILALAAIVMLVYEPFYLFQVSFQLSFISLLSILFFQPKISSWWRPKFKVFKFGWDLVSVSLAAQILIFPVSVYIFHQFSLSFALSSLLAVPLVTIIIFGGTLMVLSELLFQNIAQFVGNFLEQCILTLNYIIKQISLIPFSVMTDIYISEMGIAFMILSILSLMYFIVTKEKISFYVAITCLLLVVIIGAYDKIKKMQQSVLVAYDLYGNDVIDFCHGNTVFRYISGDTSDSRISLVTHNYMVKSRIQRIEISGEPFHRHNNDWIFICRTKADILRLKHTISPRFLYVASNEFTKPESVLEMVNPDTVILSPNLKPWIINKWVDLQLHFDYVVYDIKKEGAFLKVYH